MWAVRIATVAMLIVALAVLWRRHRDDPERDELVRYATLTVPGYLDELARLHALLDRLGAPAGLTPEQARSLLVDDVMPLLIRMQKRAETLPLRSPAARESNAEYAAALGAYMEMDRAAVHAIDDPAQSGEAGHRVVSAKRREGDEGVRAFMAHLRTRCERAGIKLVSEGTGTVRQR